MAHIRDRVGAEQKVIEELVALSGLRVADVGCGEGRLTAFLARRADSVLAFDPNEDRVAETRSALPRGLRPRVRFAVAGAADFEAPGPLDLALCAWSL